MSDDNNPNWFIRLLKAMLFSPLNSLAILALLYFGFQAYVLGNSPWLNKMYMLGVVALWAFLFLAKNLLKLILNQKTMLVDLLVILVQVIVICTTHSTLEKSLGIHISKDLNYYFVEHSGLEPLTSTLPVSRSSQMS